MNYAQDYQHTDSYLSTPYKYKKYDYICLLICNTIITVIRVLYVTCADKQVIKFCYNKNR